ncbi:MAG: cytochrome c biogenesis protein CcsA, partial [Alphaproteobacteria bacterium]|nr:cytochrome c biogenesis protein CcsA [Alphaproteobacteria bacterium]
FSFAVGALVTRKVDAAFARAMRPWVLAAWVFLTIGITAGSYWSYYILGWGGWWFWDPVENASLMPWLAATALLHSANVLAARDALRAWTIMLAVVAFSMSMVGTFLVRSGILTSVHAFAVDPRRGGFILALLVIYIGAALALFATRIASVTEGKQFEWLSREASLVINNLLLMAVLVVVLWGTIYPLLSEAFGARISIGPPFFNPIAGGIALILMLVMAAGPLLHWRREDLGAVRRRLMLPLATTVIATLIVKIAVPAIGALPLLGLGISAGLAVASVLPLTKRNLRRTPLFIYGMVLAHLGCAVSVAGMACDTAFALETLVAANIGDHNRIGPYDVTFKNIHPAFGANWTALEAELVAQRGGDTPFSLFPQSRFYPVPPTSTSQSAIATRLDGQLYLVLGQ